MDADERLTALKRAYADIILNTEKEAAARIMVSERKAVRFEIELKNAKQDAIQMLIRLKQTMDSKISEAAVASCTQDKKIEELEAQLQEAEDIVKDLREELRTVEAELEKFSQIKVKHTVHVDNVPSREPITFPPSEVQLNSYNQTNKSQAFFNSLFPLKKSLISNGDLPSIILRRKETELYRNGCTQRIRACERATPDNKSSFSLQTNDVNKNANPKLISKEDEVLEKELVLEEVKEIDLAADTLCPTSPNSVKHTNDVNKNVNAKLISKENEVLEKDLVLEEVKEIDLAADYSCLTSANSIKHATDITIDENIVRMCNSQRSRVEEVDPPLVSTEPKLCKINEVPSQVLAGRVIKYTFQRKRKRGALIGGSGSGEGSHENQTAHMESAKGNSIGESTPEKIRLEQVACQMMSSSERERQ